MLKRDSKNIKKRKTYSPEFKTQIVLRILKEEQTMSQIASEYGVHPNQLSQWKNQFLKDAASVFRDEQKPITQIKEKYENQINKLYMEIGKLTTDLNWLKKNVDILSRDERIALIEPDSSDISLSRQAMLLGFNRSGLYYKPAPVSEEEVALKHRIDEIYTDYPFFGSLRITVLLKSEGLTVNRKTVVRHMREMGIEAIYPKPNSSKGDLRHRIYPYLLRGVSIEKPNQVWGINITYIRLRKGWMYLVAIIDWFSRFIVSWELDQTLEIGFVLEVVNNGFRQAKPEIFNSDQGSHFTSPQYTDLLKDANISISIDGKGRAIDNVFTERFWRSLKYEEVYLKDYSAPLEARAGIRNYIDFYNTRRPHQSLNYSTPAVVYAGR